MILPPQMKKKKGKASVSSRKCKFFQDIINSGDLMDHGFIGSRYTW